MQEVVGHDLDWIITLIEGDQRPGRREIALKEGEGGGFIFRGGGGGGAEG